MVRCVLKFWRVYLSIRFLLVVGKTFIMLRADDKQIVKLLKPFQVSEPPPRSVWINYDLPSVIVCLAIFRVWNEWIIKLKFTNNICATLAWPATCSSICCCCCSLLLTCYYFSILVGLCLLPWFDLLLLFLLLLLLLFLCRWCCLFERVTDGSVPAADYGDNDDHYNSFT